VQNSKDRILTTHAGSLLRPVEIVIAMRAKEAGEPYDEAALAVAARRSVADVVRRQAEAGIDVPSDGEQAKASFFRYLNDRLAGLTPTRLRAGETLPTQLVGKDRQDFAAFYSQYDPLAGSMWLPPEVPRTSGPPGGGRAICEGPISYKGQALLKADIANFKAALTGQNFVEAFLPSASPTIIQYGSINRHYASDEEYAYAVAEAMKTEYRAIVEAGFILQVDAPEMPANYDRRLVEGVTVAEYRRYATLCVEATNYALEAIPEERIRYHICWGSWNGPHTTDIPLRDIADILLKVNAQAYSVEAANPRHEHEWEVWKTIKLPEGKILIPGVISHVTNVVEHPELVAMRLKNYASVVGRENVIAGTDCGFSQGWNSARLHPQIQWAKLKTLAEGAALASKDLWRH
jgi:5-methyltetrahydropteroyltriglutamate--homocysteine methyltransferase